MSRLNTITALAVALLLLLPAAANAARVTTSFDPGVDDPTEAVLRVTAAPGERNRIVIDRTRTEFIVRDSGSAPTGGSRGCRRVSGRELRCLMRASDFDSVLVSAGDRDDLVDVKCKCGVTLSGGAGDDELRSRNGENGGGFEGLQQLRGGPGDDRLVGGTAGDDLLGGPGRDKLIGLGNDDTLQGDAGADQLDGGAGEDATWHQSRTPVTIDLRRGTQVAGSERDRLVSIENATTGAGDDRVTGTDGENWIFTHGGDDVITSGGGDDWIQPGRGRNRVSAGAGDDQIDLYDDDDQGAPGPSTYDCGAGKDFMPSGELLTAASTIPTSCESVDDEDSGASIFTTPKAWRGDTVVFRIRCLDPSIRLRVEQPGAGGGLLGTATGPCSAKELAVPLTPDAARRARQPGGLAVVVSERTPEGEPQASKALMTFGLTLRAP